MLPRAQEKTELIEVVRITDPMGQSTAESLTGREVALWEAEQVTDALALIGSLPDGEVYRCFLPGWGIRAHSATGLLFQIAFCFRCHGARLFGPGVSGGMSRIHGFDADSGPALELLQLFRDSQHGRLGRFLRRR
ncbi:hypothetical protein SSPIM334S_04453 [Streptomyces spiroverticillatus]